MTDALTTCIGWAGSAVSICIPVPQLIKSWTTKKTDDLSMWMVIIFILNGCLWVTYGYRLAQPPMITSSAISLVFCIIQLGLKLKYDTKKSNR